MSAPLSNEELADIVRVSLQAGRLLHENGANTSRVERAVQRIGLALGAEDLEVTATSSFLIASAVSGPHHRTRLQRPGGSLVQLSRLGEVLEIEAQVAAGQLTAGELQDRLDMLQHNPVPVWPGWALPLAAGLGCAASAVRFGGFLPEFGIVFVSAAVAQAVRSRIVRTRLGGFLGVSVVAALLSFLVILLTRTLGNVASTGVSLAATILILNPGVAMLSGAADLFRGYNLAGLDRLTYATVHVVAAVLGIWGVSLGLNLHVERLATHGPAEPLLNVLMGGLASAGFAVLFGAPRRSVVPAACVGLAAVAAQVLCLGAGAPPPVAALAAGFTVGVAAEGLSRLLHTPYPTFAVPGYVPLIPGAPFIHGVLAVVAGDLTGGLTTLIGALILLTAAVIGMLSVPTLFDVQQRGLS